MAAGMTSGECMHKARHIAGQRVLDATGNLKGRTEAAGSCLDPDDRRLHADWDIDQLAATIARVLTEDDDG
jgi:hypothetical protein